MSRGLGQHFTRARNNLQERLPGLGNSAGLVFLALGSLKLLTDGAVAVAAGPMPAGVCFEGSLGYSLLAKPGGDDPVGQADAYARDKSGWSAAEQNELANHERNGSFVKLERSEFDRLTGPRRNIIKFTWVYKVKRDGRMKARLCVQGCRQVRGIDYDQTYSGALRGPSLRLLSAVAARQGLKMRRWDFVAAYLQGSLLDGEVVYCSAPSGYATYGTDGLPHIYKVVKPIYGMAQAGRRWQRSLYPWLKEQGFTQLHSDNNVFRITRTMDTPR